MTFKNIGSAVTSPSRPVAGRTDQALADRTANALCEQSAAGQRGRPRQSRRTDAPMGVAKIDRRQLRQLTPHASNAVGTPITERPPHRTVRAAFPHTAPTSDVDGWPRGLPYALRRL